ncbi:uncharacterized protein LOC111260457 [Varroa jacobsoni]|uniref:uncharacterized protein LOC111260457 n=1 Tax=Varroa jacobsoni TaxID=62625 RepID=UPI000BF8F270|nr:uncharacterized protein LOC111260457 [Varroa jacobsoni]
MYSRSLLRTSLDIIRIDRVSQSPNFQSLHFFRKLARMRTVDVSPEVLEVVKVSRDLGGRPVVCRCLTNVYSRRKEDEEQQQQQQQQQQESQRKRCVTAVTVIRWAKQQRRFADRGGSTRG